MATKKDLPQSLQKMSTEEKKALIDSLQASIAPPVYTRENAIADISKLPQSRYISDFDMHDWLDKVYEYDPERLQWHVRRLSGIGGSEIGTLWMSLNDQYHPFHSCTDVVCGKFLKEMPLAPEGNLQRGSMMEDPILRVKFREQMTKKYTANGQTVRFRDDLFEKFMYYKDPDPQLSWLIGTPDDIVEVDGKLIIVDYKAPTSGTIAALQRYPQDRAPIYYEAQLHHYASIAEKVGLPVGGLMLASLDYDKFVFDVREIDLRRDFQKELIDAGNYYWNDFVLTGQIPPPGTKKAFSKEVALSGQLQEDVKEYAVLSTLMNHFKSRRDRLQDALQNTGTPISLDIDVIQAGMVNIEACRTYDEKKLVAYLEEMGVDTSTVYEKNDFNDSALLQGIKTFLGNVDHTDPLLDTYRQKSEDGGYTHVNMGNLVDLARKNNINLSQFILSETCKMALSRSKTGMGPSLRVAMSDKNDEVSREAIDELSKTYDSAYNQFQQAMSQNNSSKPKPVI
jgi:predicted phage-related endonuclease